MSSKIQPLNPIPFLTRPKPTNSGGLAHILRDQFTIQTWLLMGAALQSILFLLPLRPTYTVLPAILLLFITATDTLLVTLGWKPNTYLAGTTDHKYSAILPHRDGSFGPSHKGNNSEDSGKVVILILGFRVNHPLGLLAPHARETGEHFQKMMSDLKSRSNANGFLGSTPFLGADSRTTKSEIMTHFYFRSLEDVETFAHAPIHREAWNWWNQEAKQGNLRHVGIYHEVYEAPKGRWENVYANSARTGLGAAVVPVEVDGEERWVDPCVDASRGPLSTHKGRTAVMI